MSLFSYAMAANFLESLVILLLLLGLCAFLPARFLRDDFIVRGTILAIGLLVALMTFVSSLMRFGIDSGLRLLIAPLAVLLLMSFLLQCFSKYPRLRSSAIWVSDHVVVFLFILIPLFAVASVYVIYRNIA